MLTYLLVLSTLLLAVISLWATWRGAKAGLRYGWHRLLFALAIGSFTYLYGTWLYLSIYLKYVFGALLLLELVAGLIKANTTKPSHRTGSLTVHIIFTIIFGGLCILFFTGTTGKAEKVALSFPLKKGRYIILQGGKGLPTNFFHYSYRGAVYAIDIARLNDYGNRADEIYGDDLTDYEIFADTIYSPCDGVIDRVRTENPDNPPGIRKRGPSNTNQVLIDAGNYYVFMAHLMQNGVFVKEGQRVRKGQPLGLVGNSGFSLEPHLHIQAHKKTGRDGWYHEPPLLIEFDGRSYLLFETIRPKRVNMVGE